MVEQNRKLDLLISETFFELTDEQAHCWPPSAEAFLEEAHKRHNPLFQLKRYRNGSHVYWECLRPHCSNKIIEGLASPICHATVKQWTKDISEAWAVVRKLQQIGYIVKLWSPDKDLEQLGIKQNYWECAFWKYIDTRTGKDDPDFNAPFEYRKEIGASAIAETAPLAVCLAALRTVGIEI